MLRHKLGLILILCAIGLGAAWRQDMQDQPKCKPYRESESFSDASCMRHPPEGTIARGMLRTDTQLFTGKVAQASTAPPAANGGSDEPPDVTAFPFPITPEVMTRGKERYEIYCSVCHGLTGQGDGMIVRRGYRKPPAYTDPRLLDAAVGHFFDVVTNGWGAMPSYAQQIPVQDRWAIIAYVRALQYSQSGHMGKGGSLTTNTNTSGSANSNANGNASNPANSNGATSASPTNTSARPSNSN